jgi:hypothetical protein
MQVDVALRYRDLLLAVDEALLGRRCDWGGLVRYRSVLAPRCCLHPSVWLIVRAAPRA